MASNNCYTMGNANPQVIQKSSIAGRPQGCPQAVTARPGAIQIRPYPQDRAYCSGWRVRDMDAPMDEHTTLRLHAIVLQMYRYATYEASQAPVDHSGPCRIITQPPAGTTKQACSNAV